MARPGEKPAPTEGRYEGATLAKLRKYRLANEDGTLRETDVPGKGAGPVMSPEVIGKFLELDPTRKKNVFDWILFQAGGGKPAQAQTERTLGLAKDHVVDRLMRGIRDEEHITPLTQEQAEAEWAENEHVYREAYSYGDEDLASDPQYPIFGYFRDWPGRSGVYEKIYNTVKGYQAILADKKQLQLYNRLFPNAPFLTDITQYENLDELTRLVTEFKRKIAQRRAEKDIRFYGKSGSVGKDEVVYKDDIMRVVVPATAAASMKAGFPNWCISNRTRFQTYFGSGAKSDLLWGNYCSQGPFVFWQFSPQFEDEKLQKVAGHINMQMTQFPGAHKKGLEPGRMQFWDGNNNQIIHVDTIRQRLEAEMPGAGDQFDKSIEAVKEWFSGWEPEKIERYPALENIHRAARALADQVLAG